ncbi:unnamed protein product [Cyprideis torosa]|uniref:valine--tRNA ligase n=1 Tax=Cyprideis torosa TaxID=163714 RepID=A0A7R8WK63_9CRUS|nr:unnamed protein product [Cyprideis torosa]CAG0902729.1 unnamed protein product [Cyprideis torosa]
MKRQVKVPLVGREVPIIGDEYVDMEFGTGCLKVTPAHDMNDFELGKKHGLESIEIFHADARLNEQGMQFEGQDRFHVRKAMLPILEKEGVLEKVEDYNNKMIKPPYEQVDMEEEISKAEKDLEYFRGFLKSAEKKLGNERFVSGAPKEVVENERKKAADAMEKIAMLEDKLNKMKS